MSSSVFVLQVSPSIPPSLQRLDDLAKNFLVQLERRARCSCSARSTPRCGARSRAARACSCVPSTKAFSSTRPPIRASSDEYRRIVAAFDDYLGAKLDLLRWARARGPDRLFLRRVRLARELPDLLGRPGRARRRSLQDRERSSPAVRRGRACCIARAIFISASTAAASRSPTTRRSIRAALRSCWH